VTSNASCPLSVRRMLLALQFGIDGTSDHRAEPISAVPSAIQVRDVPVNALVSAFPTVHVIVARPVECASSQDAPSRQLVESPTSPPRCTNSASLANEFELR